MAANGTLSHLLIKGAENWVVQKCKPIKKAFQNCLFLANKKVDSKAKL